MLRCHMHSNLPIRIKFIFYDDITCSNLAIVYYPIIYNNIMHLYNMFCCYMLIDVITHVYR